MFIKLVMARFEPGSSGVRIDHFANRCTTTITTSATYSYLYSDRSQDPSPLNWPVGGYIVLVQLRQEQQHLVHQCSRYLFLEGPIPQAKQVIDTSVLCVI